MRGRFSQAKSIAKQRGLCFDFTVEQYVAVRSQPCRYCGFPLPETGIGLDRKDSNIGYTIDNTVPCCMECNSCKTDVFTYDEMLEIGHAIRRVKQQRQQSGGGEIRTSLGAPAKYGHSRRFDRDGQVEPQSGKPDILPLLPDEEAS